MLELPHVALGAAIATKIPNPWLSIPLALASHIILDQIPHWNPHFYTETQKFGKPKKNSLMIAAVDATSALFFGLAVAFSFPDPVKVAVVIICCFLSVLPDLAKIPFFLLNFRPPFLKKYVLFERSIQVDTTFWPGILTQLAVVLVSLFWILN